MRFYTFGTSHTRTIIPPRQNSIVEYLHDHRKEIHNFQLIEQEGEHFSINFTRPNSGTHLDTTDRSDSSFHILWIREHTDCPTRHCLNMCERFIYRFLCGHNCKEYASCFRNTPGRRYCSRLVTTYQDVELNCERCR